ncbi:kelch-like protein 4 [Eupeodes corollae]|uniref:kelch-like protein 4 n=1 Tax=Eupeodes corollae TaxID=290404 RepID=UPI0024909A8D|nr:kelch-like protein 4 [Eupeodes corollae]
MTTLNLAKETETFLYKCDGHSANISQKLLNLYKKVEFCDTIIYAGSNSIEIEVHSVVLTALSDYFSEIFRDEQSESRIINLQEIDASALKLVIDFLYSGCIELRLETVERIFRTAEVLKLHDLLNVCYDFIDKHTTPQNCLDFFRLANEFKFPALQDNCLAYAYAHFEEVIKQQNVMVLSEDELKDFLFYENPMKNP